MTELPPLYLEAVRLLAKAEGQQLPKVYLRDLNRLMDAQDPKVAKAMLKVAKRARTRFRRKVSVDALADIIASVHKSASSDAVKARLKKILDAAFEGAAADLVASESDLIDAMAKQFATVYQVDLNFNLVSTKAVEYLTTNAENYFTKLSDLQADGLLAEAGAELASDSKYTIRDVAARIRNAFLNDALYYPVNAGVRTLDVTDWAMLVARTETARAASFAQKATLESIGLKTWQWKAQDSCCDECDDNDDEIVTVGDDFPSGDSEPPAHPNCRCICTAVLSELDSLKDDTEDTPEE